MKVLKTRSGHDQKVQNEHLKNTAEAGPESAATGTEVIEAVMKGAETIAENGMSVIEVTEETETAVGSVTGIGITDTDATVHGPRTDTTTSMARRSCA